MNSFISSLIAIPGPLIARDGYRRAHMDVLQPPRNRYEGSYETIHIVMGLQLVDNSQPFSAFCGLQCRLE